MTCSCRVTGNWWLTSCEGGRVLQRRRPRNWRHIMLILLIWSSLLRDSSNPSIIIKQYISELLSICFLYGICVNRLPKGDFFPVCVALGMITLSTSFGIYTALHQLGRAPNVSVRKSRRETVPEVADPEHVTEDAEKFVKQSFFRKVAHIQGSDRQEIMSNPIGGDVLARYVLVLYPLNELYYSRLVCLGFQWMDLIWQRFWCMNFELPLIFPL